MAIAMDIYEKIRYYREHTDFSQRNVAKILGISRNTVKKYWEGQTVPWERKPGSGRKKDIIIRNGNNISAVKIESALLELSYVKDAAVIAAYDESAGEIPCAMVALKAGEKRTEEEILRDLTRFLTKIEMPVRISPTEKLPLTSTGKTDKEKIKKFFSESRKIK